MTALQPLFDRIIVRKDENRSSSGLYLGDSNDKTVYGTVIAAGPGRLEARGAEGAPFHMPMQVAVGNRVLFSPNVALEISIDGEKLHLMREADVIGIQKEQQ